MNELEAILQAGEERDRSTIRERLVHWSDLIREHKAEKARLRAALRVSLEWTEGLIGTYADQPYTVRCQHEARILAALKGEA